MLRPWDDGTNSNRQRAEPRARGVRVRKDSTRLIIAGTTAMLRRKVRRSRSRTRILTPSQKVLKEEQKRTGIKLLWGTASAFSNPLHAQRRDELQCRCVRVRCRADQEGDKVTHELKGRRLHVLGRARGYMTLLNTDMKARVEPSGCVAAHGGGSQEEDRVQRPVLHRAEAERADKHQYDSDSAACLSFLREHDLLPHFKLNIETNHATLAGHASQHELGSRGRSRRARQH